MDHFPCRVGENGKPILLLFIQIKLGNGVDKKTYSPREEERIPKHLNYSVETGRSVGQLCGRHQTRRIILHCTTRCFVKRGWVVDGWVPSLSGKGRFEDDITWKSRRTQWLKSSRDEEEKARERRSWLLRDLQSRQRPSPPFHRETKLLLGICEQITSGTMPLEETRKHEKKTTSRSEYLGNGRAQQGHVVGGSNFGWNFIMYPGGDAVYYGVTKESFLASYQKNEDIPS
ncbi:hypothetical protein Scep_006281 [Stephania cephalantha]|uniref:Uncharacterized protein n=1 Tax=Stephania cephalantha TaxID=152367 RepID=A0AAP0K993_9MAGN